MTNLAFFAKTFFSRLNHLPKLLLLLIVLSFCKEQLHAQGILRGTVLDGADNTPLAGATVMLLEAETGTYTGLDGAFEFLQLKQGSYTLVISYVTYNNDTLRNVLINSGQTTTLSCKLMPEGTAVNTVEITAVVKSSSNVALISELKSMNQVANGLTGQQIAMSQDRNAGQAVRRVPGVVIGNGQFINIRGLNERYSVVLLNDVIAPSLEADKRAFSFDIFPSSMIDRLMVYKTTSPDFYADFGGGLVRIYTKTIPDANEINVGLSLGYLRGSSFQNYRTGESNGLTAFGLGAGGLNLPSNLLGASPSDPLNINQSAASLPNNWGIGERFAGPDARLQFNINRVVPIKNSKTLLGSITALSYGLANTRFEILRADYDDVSAEQFRFNDVQYGLQSTFSLLQNFAVRFGDNHEISFKNALINIGSDQFTERTGVNRDAGFDEKQFSYNYVQRTVYTGQLSGAHKFLNKTLVLDWTAGYSFSARHEPDFRRVTLIRDIGSSEPYKLSIPASADIRAISRFFSELNEHNYTALVNVGKQFRIGPLKPTFKVGGFFEYRQRDFYAKMLGIRKSRANYFNDSIAQLSLDQVFNESNFNLGRSGLAYQELTEPTDAYTADNLLAASYLSIDLPIGSRLKVFGGLRVEHNNQRINFRTRTGAPDSVGLAQTLLLPSFGATVFITNNLLGRLSYGRTVNRPQFRELAPFAYYDFNLFALFYGNPDLTPATLSHYDARLEWYPTLAEQVSVAFFYKDLTNAIEARSRIGSGGNREFDFQNVPLSYTYGFEFELRKNLSFLDNWFKTKFFSDITLVGNYTWIKSEVKSVNSTGEVVPGGRPLQGQAPYIINGSVFYKNDSIGLSLSLQYNVVGATIFAVGNALFPSIIQVPRHSLDFTIQKSIGKYITLRAGIENILDAPFVLAQDANKDHRYNAGDGANGIEGASDLKIMEYRRGQYITLGFNVSF